MKSSLSLKSFHLVFIGLCVSFCLFFAGWCWLRFQNGHQAYLFLAIFSGIAAVSLIVYGQVMLKKLRALLLVWLGIFSFWSTSSFACAVCYADPEDSAAKALIWGVVVLLGFIIFVLSGFLALIVQYRRRMKKLHNPEMLRG